jgi:hypothetical protein
VDTKWAAGVVVSAWVWQSAHSDTLLARRNNFPSAAGLSWTAWHVRQAIVFEPAVKGREAGALWLPSAGTAMLTGCEPAEALVTTREAWQSLHISWWWLSMRMK